MCPTSAFLKRNSRPPKAMRANRYMGPLRYLVLQLRDSHHVYLHHFLMPEGVDSTLRSIVGLSSLPGGLMFQIIAAMAEFERALLQERVRQHGPVRCCPECAGRTRQNPWCS